MRMDAGDDKRGGNFVIAPSICRTSTAPVADFPSMSDFLIYRRQRFGDCGQGIGTQRLTTTSLGVPSARVPCKLDNASPMHDWARLHTCP